MFIVAAPFQAALSQLGLDSFARVRAHFLRGKKPDKTTVVVRPAALAWPNGETVEVFYKQYEYAPPAWTFIGRKSKARREYENYAVFARLGLSCAQPIACGEDRDGLGRLRRAFILTQAISNALTLKDYFEQQLGDRADVTLRRHRATALRQLADATRSIHAADFFSS